VGGEVGHPGGVGLADDSRLGRGVLVEVAGSVVAQRMGHSHPVKVAGESNRYGLGRTPRGAEERPVRRADGDEYTALVGVCLSAFPGIIRFQIRKDLESPAGRLLGPDGGHPVGVCRGCRPLPATGREVTEGIVVVMEGQSDLLEVVLAAQSVGSLPDLLHGGQQQADEDSDHPHHHQQLEQGEPTTTRNLAKGVFHDLIPPRRSLVTRWGDAPPPLEWNHSSDNPESRRATLLWPLKGLERTLCADQIGRDIRFDQTRREVRFPWGGPDTNAQLGRPLSAYGRAHRPLVRSVLEPADRPWVYPAGQPFIIPQTRRCGCLTNMSTLAEGEEMCATRIPRSPQNPKI